MTTQLNSSPFNSEASANPTPISAAPPQNDFVIHTMKEDAAALQKNGFLSSTQAKTATPIQTEIKLPTPAPTYIPAPAHASAPTPAPAPTSTPTPAPIPAHAPTMAPVQTPAAPFKPTAPPVNAFAASPEPKIISEPKPAPKPAEPVKSDGKPASVKIILAIVVVLIISILGLGAYYFFITSQTEPVAVVETPAPIETPTPAVEIPAELPVIIEPAPEKYSAEKPNYLTLDLNSLSPAEIKAAITSVTEELKTIATSATYEFIVVDANNNPVAFPIFAIASGLKLSPALLSSLDESFSLFAFNEGGNVRLGFSAKITQPDSFKTEITKQEKTLSKDLALLFLGETPSTAAGQFKDGSYRELKTRYLNLNPTETLSIDYAIKADEFILGTSKNTLRAIIDKATSRKNSPSASTEKVAPTTGNNSAALIGTCIDLPTKLNNCTPFVCSASGLTQEIIGIANGKCSYTQQLPNNGKMDCNYTADMQKKVAAALKEFFTTGNSSASVSSSGTATEITSSTGGSANPMQEALEAGQCVVLGY